jgi:hypothetical protein
MVRTVFATGRSVTSLFTLLIAALVCATATPSAHSASLERLGDGRVVITAFGERLAFREKDAGNIFFYWPKYNCDPEDGSGSNLARWLDDSKVAECLNRTIPDGVVPGERRALLFKIFLTYEDGRKYPGVGKRIDQPLGNVPPLYPGGVKPEELPEPPLLSGQMYINVDPSYAGEACTSPVEVLPDALGYRTHPGGKSPPSVGYILPPDRRPGHASRPLCVSCRQIGTWDCSVNLRSSDKTVSLSLEWFDRNFQGPQSTWTLYDAAARKIAQSIFIDHPSGDVQ